MMLSMKLPLGKGIPSVLADGYFPKGEASAIRLRHAHHPLTREQAPQNKRGPTADTGAAIEANYKELC